MFKFANPMYLILFAPLLLGMIMVYRRSVSRATLYSGTSWVTGRVTWRIALSWLMPLFVLAGTPADETPGWTWNSLTSSYFFDGNTVSGNPNIALMMQNNVDIGFLDVTRNSNNANFALYAPLADVPDTVLPCISKAAKNTTGQTANDLEFIIKGVFSSIKQRSTAGFPFFEITPFPATSLTEFRWYGSDVAIDEYRVATVCIDTPDPLKLVTAKWTEDGTNIGCAYQINVDVDGDGQIAFRHDLLCHPGVLWVGNIGMEYYNVAGGPPTHFSLQDSASRLPIASESLPGTILLNAGESAPPPTLPSAPADAAYVVVIFDVDTDSSFANATRDYVLINLTTLTPSVPAIQRHGYVAVALILALVGALLIRARAGAPKVADRV
jgi:hypothetical protein